VAIFANLKPMNKIIENWDWWYFAEHNKALATSLIVVFVLIVAYAISQVVFRVLKSQLKERDFTLFTLFRKNCYSPGVMVFLGFGLVILLPFVPVDEHLLSPINRGLAIFQICCVAWLLIRIIKSMRDYMVYKYVREGVNTEISARKVLTQFRIFGRVLVFVIVILALTASLMTFDEVRKIGYSILASAGLLSVIVGFAAQRSIATVLAGLQIAIAQPIRIDDVVVVEEEWGRVEEITLTYVVIRIWDERRMVVPINYFIEKPFFNWTRNTNKIMGTLKIPIDYRADVDTIRQVFLKLVYESIH
jgi:small-conductance mechanosensitive channel